MNRRYPRFSVFALASIGLLVSNSIAPIAAQSKTTFTANKGLQQLLYGALPGIRDYLQYRFDVYH